MWIDERYLKYAEFYTVVYPLSPLQWVLIGVGIGVVVLIIIVVISVCIVRRNASRFRRRERETGPEMVQLKQKTILKTND